MELSALFWTILGEIAIVLIGLLSAMLFIQNKDRNKLKEYMHSLKKMIKELKKKIQALENEKNEERILTLFNDLISHVRDLHQLKDEGAENEEDKLSIENFIIVSLFQTLTTVRNALENSNDAQDSWEKIKNEITPLIENYLQPIIIKAQSQAVQAEESGDDSLQTQLENANKRITNLEKFKDLFFDLQSKLSDSVSEIEGLNHKIAELAEGSDNFDEIMAIIQQNKTHYINMGQMIAMDKDAHHESVSSNMDYSDNLINERKDEISRLKHQISSQFEEIWALHNKLSNSSANKEPSTTELNSGIETMVQQLKDSEMCIETMDMEIQTLSSELLTLKNKLKDQQSSTSQNEPSKLPTTQSNIELENKIKNKDQMIARFSQESKELLSCITGMEDHSDEQAAKINELEEKYTKLEAEYNIMEEKYLAEVSK